MTNNELSEFITSALQEYTKRVIYPFIFDVQKGTLLVIKDIAKKCNTKEEFIRTLEQICKETKND